jgi:hypothetical protein
MRPELRARCRWMLAFAVVTSAADGASAQGAAAADALVRARYYEGVPYAAARAVDAEGARHLEALLVDPDARAIRAQIALVLGVAAQPGAFEALAAAAERGASGEVDRASHALALALPLAMGHLARSDARAYGWLRDRALGAGGDPGWSHGAHAGRALGDELRRAAVSGLATSGRPEALADLQALGAAGARRAGAIDPELDAALAEARALWARVATEGPDAVFAAE